MCNINTQILKIVCRKEECTNVIVRDGSSWRIQEHPEVVCVVTTNRKVERHWHENLNVAYLKMLQEKQLNLVIKMFGIEKMHD